MRKEQIERDFSELFIGQNPKRLTREYYKKKTKEMVILIFAAMVIVVLCAVNDWKNSNLEGDKIVRNEEESGKEEITLQVKTEEKKWQELNLELYPKEYSEKELEQLFKEACNQLQELICAENESLSVISSDLDLVQEIEGFPFWIEWESSDDRVMDTEGKLILSGNRVEKLIELTATFQYENWEKTYVLPVNIKATAEKEFLSLLKESLQEQEKMTRENREFELPDIFRQRSLQWRYPPGNSATVLGILFLIMLPFVSCLKDREIHNQTKKRKEQLQENFPEFISKLILLLEAGMSIKSALIRIAGDYEKQRREKKYLYEELLHICRQMNNGLSEKEAFELLAKRCNLACYKKLSGLLIQHLQKGGNSLLETLRNESDKTREEQRRRIQKKGEEMGTKLLFPMIIMLGMVMVFIMVPALFSFQM